MKRQLILTCAVVLCLTGCSDRKPQAPPKLPKVDTQTLLQQHEMITHNSILADFVACVSSNDYATAFQMLHPKLGSAWTEKQFSNDWSLVKSQLGDEWGPEATGSFSGTSPQGPYQQATYRLSSDWRSTSSADLVSMETEEGTRIVKVHLRVLNGEAGEDAKGIIDQFVRCMRSKDYDAASLLFSPTSRAQYPPQLLQQIAPVLGESADATRRVSYRLCANTLWYDAVRLTPTNDPATFVEIVVSTENESPQIVQLSFKGRMRM